MWETSDNLLSIFDFYVLPVVNPDGYVYTWGTDRFWRGNRNKNYTHNNCHGVDLNRNWGYHWGESGVSNNPCSDIYCGTGPFSEYESQNIKNYVEALSPKPVLGHCMHSYSQLWLWPYGYENGGPYPENVEMNKSAFQPPVCPWAAVT